MATYISQYTIIHFFVENIIYKIEDTKRNNYIII